MPEQVSADNQTDKNKRDKAILLELTKFCYENFDKRRNKEWKFSIAIWTALAAFSAICFKESVHVEFSLKFCIPAIITGLAIIVLQSLLHYALFSANEVDKSKSYYYEDILNDSMDINYRDDPKVKKAMKNNKGKKWTTPITHVLITVLLIILAIFALYANKKTETTSDKIECGQKISIPCQITSD
jgi:uncharacterized integral membrane protein